MPTIDIDGRGQTVAEAVQDMWQRVQPLEKEGYHAVTSVEVVEVRTKKIVESFEITDPEWSYLKSTGAPKKGAKELHRPPKPHDYKFKARITLEN